MGSSGSKPRKPVHHLPKVGTPANLDYEVRQKRREVFGGLPTILWAVGVTALVLLFVIATA